MTDQDILKRQLRYLNKIRGMNGRDLRLHYRKVFSNSRYYVRPTLDIPRDWIEQRLFYAYCLKHPAYAEGTEERLLFNRVAKDVLLRPPPVDVPKEKILKQELKKRVLFTKANIRKMDIKEVDAYLAVLGITVTDQPPKVRRYVLWEFYAKRSSDLIKLRSNKNSSVLARRPRSELDNQFVLSDIIAKFPYMGWPEFQETFGELMPRVTRKSFYAARTRFNKRHPGYLPRLLPGRRSSRVSPVTRSHKGRVPARPVDMSVQDIELEEFNK